MSGSNSGSNTSKMAVPQAKEAMNRFKQEVASEIGVPLKEGYNGDLTSAQAGSIGGRNVQYQVGYFDRSIKQLSCHSRFCSYTTVPYLLAESGSRGDFPRGIVFLFPHLGVPYSSGERHGTDYKE